MQRADSRGDGLAWLPVLAIIALFYVMLAGFYVPAYEGVDENGYLCTARRIVLRGTTAKYTAHPLEYVSDNVVQNDAGVFYAKYPLGYPWLCALAYWIGGPTAAYLVNPILAALALVGMFLLARAMVNPFAGVLAVILLATNPWHASFGLSVSSHTGAICFAVWGMYFLWRWLESGGLWNAFATGALTAYACDVRYSEAMLALPVLVMIAWRYRHLPEGAIARWRWEVLLMIFAAVATVTPLLIHHWIAFGAFWRTGYGLCGETGGFGWKWFQENWWLMLGKLSGPGLFLVFPLGLAGLACVAATDRRKGLLLWLWCLPNLLLYSAYYWAPQDDNGNYLRFFSSIFPALIVAALALLCAPSKSRPLWTMALGVFVAIVATVNLRAAIKEMSDQADDLRLYEIMCDNVRHYIPNGSIILAAADCLNSLEYVGDYELYSTQTFDRNLLTWRTGMLADTNGVHPFQVRKAQFLQDTLGHLNDGRLATIEQSILSSNIAAGRQIAVVTATVTLPSLRGQLGGAFGFKPITEWYQVTYGKNNEPHPLLVSLLWLQSPAPNPPLAGSLAALEEKIDQTQFQVRVLREEYDDKYSGARVKQEEINTAERQLQALRDKSKILAVLMTNTVIIVPGQTHLNRHL